MSLLTTVTLPNGNSYGIQYGYLRSFCKAVGINYANLQAFRHKKENQYFSILCETDEGTITFAPKLVKPVEPVDITNEQLKALRQSLQKDGESLDDKVKPFVTSVNTPNKPISIRKKV